MENSGTYITKLLTVGSLAAKPNPARDSAGKTIETIDLAGFRRVLNHEILVCCVTQPLQKDKNLITRIFCFFAYMKKLILLLVTTLLTSIFTMIHGQSQFSGWGAAFNTLKVGKKTSIHADVQLRSNDEIKQIQTVLLRTGLNYHINKKIIVTAGYAFISNKRVISNVPGFAPEHRVWEQLIYNHKLKNIFTSHRFRIEQRFIGKSIVLNNELKNDGTAYANRFRYFIRNILPLTNKTSFQKGVFAALQNEVFVNFGSTSNVNGKFFDQNRLYLAMGYRLNIKSDIEIGYMNQYINGKGTAFTNNHILQLATYFRL